MKFLVTFAPEKKQAILEDLEKARRQTIEQGRRFRFVGKAFNKLQGTQGSMMFYLTYKAISDTQVEIDFSSALEPVINKNLITKQMKEKAKYYDAKLEVIKE
jgi:hypothetical protein